MPSEENNTLNLWNKYAAERSLEVKHKLVINYVWLVKYVLQNMNLPINALLTEEDFLSIGILGLHEAIDRFELDRGVKFESYAVPRIKGTIQDELRRLDWLSRTARKKAHEYMQASDLLRSQEGREVSAEEIRRKLNVSPEEYQSYLSAAAAAKSSYAMNETTQFMMDDDYYDVLNELPDTSPDSNMLDKIESEERIAFITDYLQKLSERKRNVMTLYYYENLTFKDIGNMLDVSESRVCQIHSQIIADLRKKLYEFDNA